MHQISYGDFAMKKKKNAMPEANEEAVQPEVTKKKTGRIFIIVSYVIALASLIAALFVPLFNGKMAFQLIWAAVDRMLAFLGISTPAFAYGDFFVAQSMRIYESALILGIAGSTVLGLIMLLPVILCKKPHAANLRCAYAAEFIAFSFVTACVMWEMLSLHGAWENFAILIPFGVIMLVMAAQSIKFKGGLGVAKFIIFLLAFLTLFTLFNITALITALEEPLKTLSGTLGAYSADVTFIGNLPSGFSYISELVRICLGRSSFADPANTVAFVHEILLMVLVIVVLASVFTDFVGLIAGNKTRKNGEPHPHKGWFVVAAIRYSLIIVLIAAIVTLSFVLDGFGKVGIYMYLTAVFVLLTFIAEIIRYCVAKSKVKAYRKEQEELFRNEKLIIKDEALEEQTTEEETTEETENIQTNMFGDEAAAEAQPVEEVAAEEPVESADEQLSIEDTQPVEEAAVEPVEEVVEAEETAVEPVVPVVPVAEEVAEPVVEESNMFNEAQDAEERESIDPFIDKLTDEERAQFYDVFINRNMGKFSSIPAYELNGDNSDFFPSVFVHINRMRNLCSDSLLAKIYKEIGKD